MKDEYEIVLCRLSTLPYYQIDSMTTMFEDLILENRIDIAWRK